MNTPGLIEALFQTDLRREVTRMCQAWGNRNDYLSCMERHYPQGMSADGVLLLKIAAAVLLFGVIFGAVRELYNARSYLRQTWRSIAQWEVIGDASARGALNAWKTLIYVGTIILLVQVLMS